MKVLHINSSTRGENSQSLLIAEQVITQLKIKHADLVVDEFNLFEDDLPAFDKNAVGAKMALFTGQDSNSKEKEAWTKIKEVYDRFASADIYVFNVPLWNNNIPYILKQFIDVNNGLFPCHSLNKISLISRTLLFINTRLLRRLCQSAVGSFKVKV